MSEQLTRGARELHMHRQIRGAIICNRHVAIILHAGTLLGVVCAIVSTSLCIVACGIVAIAVVAK